MGAGETMSELETKYQSPAGPAVGHETTDADVKPILKFLVGLGLLLVLVMVGMTLFFNALESRFQRTGKEVSPLVDTAQVPPGPRLQPNPADDLRRLRSWEQQRLAGYGWVDQDTGVFRIPIERAKQLIVEHDVLPVRRAPAGGAPQ
jgi:hypothetical protein